MDTNKSPISLELNKPFITCNANILVRGLLRVGEYQFQLIVSDQGGNRSQAAIVKVTVNPPRTLWLKLRSWFTNFLRLLTKKFK